MPSQNRVRSSLAGWTGRLTLALFAIAAVLRIVQFVAGRSLWLDEAMLARNVMDRSFRALLLPLDSSQGAPPLFLWMQKLVILSFGDGERAFRIVPLLAGFLLVYWVWDFSRRLLGRGAAVVALAIVALSGPLIYYSNEAKQYSTDAALSALLLVLGVRWLSERTPRREVVLLFAGVLAGWFSFAAVFVLAVLALVALAHLRTVRPAIVWGMGVALLFLVSIRPLVADVYLQEYWRSGYMPLPPWNDPGWVLHACKNLLDVLIGPMSLGKRMQPSVSDLGSLAAAGLLALLGVVALSRDRSGPRAPARVHGGDESLPVLARPWVRLTLVGGPVTLAFVAAVAQLHPFVDRLLLFSVPGTATAIAAAVQWLWRGGIGRRMGRPTAIVALSLALIMPALHAVECARRPVQREELRPVLDQLASQRVEAERIWVYYGAEPAFHYYARRLRLDVAGVSIGEPARREPERYVAELSRILREGSVWVVFAHVYPYDVGDEAGLLLGRLDEIAERRASIRNVGASAHLYVPRR